MYLGHYLIPIPKCIYQDFDTKVKGKAMPSALAI